MGERKYLNELEIRRKEKVRYNGRGIYKGRGTRRREIKEIACSTREKATQSQPRTHTFPCVHAPCATPPNLPPSPHLPVTPPGAGQRGRPVPLRAGGACGPGQPLRMRLPLRECTRLTPSPINPTPPLPALPPVLPPAIAHLRQAPRMLLHPPPLHPIPFHPPTPHPHPTPTPTQPQPIPRTLAYAQMYRGTNRTDCVWVNNVQGCKVRLRGCLPRLLARHQDAFALSAKRGCSPPVHRACEQRQEPLAHQHAHRQRACVQLTCACVRACVRAQVEGGGWEECSPFFTTRFPQPPPNATQRFTTLGSTCALPFV
jgi:hypothetical protein